MSKRNTDHKSHKTHKTNNDTSFVQKVNVFDDFNDRKFGAKQNKSIKTKLSNSSSSLFTSPNEEMKKQRRKEREDAGFQYDPQWRYKVDVNLEKNKTQRDMAMKGAEETLQQQQSILDLEVKLKARMYIKKVASHIQINTILLNKLYQLQHTSLRINLLQHALTQSLSNTRSTATLDAHSQQVHSTILQNISDYSTLLLKELNSLHTIHSEDILSEVSLSNVKRFDPTIFKQVSSNASLKKVLMQSVTLQGNENIFKFNKFNMTNNTKKNPSLFKQYPITDKFIANTFKSITTTNHQHTHQSLFDSIRTLILEPVKSTFSNESLFEVNFSFLFHLLRFLHQNHYLFPPTPHQQQSSQHSSLQSLLRAVVLHLIHSNEAILQSATSSDISSLQRHFQSTYAHDTIHLSILHSFYSLVNMLFCLHGKTLLIAHNNEHTHPSLTTSLLHSDTQTDSETDSDTDSDMENDHTTTTSSKESHKTVESLCDSLVFQQMHLNNKNSAGTEWTLELLNMICYVHVEVGEEGEEQPLVQQVKQHLVNTLMQHMQHNKQRNNKVLHLEEKLHFVQMIYLTKVMTQQQLLHYEPLMNDLLYLQIPISILDRFSELPLPVLRSYLRSQLINHLQSTLLLVPK